MTLYRFSASKSSLPEWGKSGFKEIAREQFNSLGIEFYFASPEASDKVVCPENLLFYNNYC
ncbi:hypothetical protein [Metasolibacillus meyeri]|uniref:hypothetical protein n=1 Tax=Metasolibacillus meyeri TaxID=1071052 RepID=UPI000D30390B|nr:hypothetical protein [Metasolibacillus meyeri]